MEAGEAPKPGCEREIVEELGLDLKLGRVLLIFHGLALGVGVTPPTTCTTVA